MSSPKLPRPKTMMLISSLMVVAMVPLVYSAVNQSDENQKRFDAISDMTESELRQLNYNLDHFQKLTPAQKEKYRELDKQLAGEQKRLKEIMESYQAFLRSLSPSDRMKIEQEHTFNKKMAAIENVFNKLDEDANNYPQYMENSEGQPRRPPSSSGGRFSRERGEPLSETEMAAMSQFLETSINLTSEQRGELKKWEGQISQTFAQLLIYYLDNTFTRSSKTIFDESHARELVARSSERRQNYFRERELKYNEEKQAFDNNPNKNPSEPPPFMIRKPLPELQDMILTFTIIQTLDGQMEELVSDQTLDEYIRGKDNYKELFRGGYDKVIREWHRDHPTPVSNAHDRMWGEIRKRFPRPEGPPAHRMEGSKFPPGGAPEGQGPPNPRPGSRIGERRPGFPSGGEGPEGGELPRERLREKVQQRIGE